VVRAFLQQPEQTVEALRATAKAVDQRRQDLAASGAADQLTALEQQRTDLKARRDASSDVEARVKFDGALRSLDGQESALKLLVAVSDRLDGEYTSLLVLLQELKTRVAVARSTNNTSQLDGLEQNVKRLNDELQAITESLVMTPVDEGATGVSLSPAGERVGERA
jgi:chromosome segregation ATPase